MKNIVSLVILFLVIITTECWAIQGACADDQVIKNYRDIPGISEAEISAIEALKSEYDSFSYGCLIETESFEMPDGTHAGFAAEFYDLLSELFEIEFVHTYCEEWEDLKNGLDSGKIEFAGIYTPIPANHEKYLASELIAGRALNSYTRSVFNDIKKGSDIANHKIAFLSGTDTASIISDRYPEISYRVVEADGLDDAVDKLYSGEVDAFIVDSAVDPRLNDYEFLQSREIFPLVYIPVTLTAADSRLEPIITVFNKYLTSGESARLFELYRKGEHDYSKYKLFQSFTDEEKAYISNRIEKGAAVDVGLQHDAYPVSFYNKNDQEFQGVAIDILGEITSLTGLEFTNITTSTDTPISVILDKLKTGEISMMTQLLYADSRVNDYLWSNAYLETNYALLSKSEYPDIGIYQVFSKKVGTVKMTAHEEMFEKWFPSHKNQIRYDTTDEAFAALENDEIELLMLSENMLLTQTNYREKLGFKINLDFYVPLESYYGFTKSEDILRSIVNKSMEYIEMSSIGNVWLNRSFDYQKKIDGIKTLYLSVFTTAIILALISMIFLFLSNKKLSKNLSERTTTLSTILASIPDTIFCKNADGVYTSCNPSFEQQAGLSESELIGKTYAEIFKDRVLENLENNNETDRKVLMEGKPIITEETIVYPDGNNRLFEVLKAPLMQNGRIIGILGIGRDVTERKEIKTRLERIINTAQIVFLMTIDNIVVEANNYSQKYIGVKIGDDIRNFYGNPDQRNDILNATEKRGTTSNVIVAYKTATGDIHRFLSSFTLVEYEQRKAYILWGIDIERDEQINDQLIAAQQTLQTIMDTLPLSVCIADCESGQMVYGNNVFAEMMELDSPGEVLGIDTANTFVGIFDDTNQHDYLINITEPIVEELRLRSAENRMVDVRAHAAPIDYYGKKAVIGFVSDLTAEKETQKILIAAAAREKEANQSKTTFLANMSHEIRTPMNGIIGMTDLLLGEQLSGRQLQYVKDVKMSAESLLGIINDILDLSKISEGKLQVTYADIDISMLLENTISMIRFTAQSKGLEFISDIQINTPEYVRADDIRLNQVLINLMSNAVKFTKKGHVKLTAKIEGDNIAFAVSDTGIGIRQEEIPLIFEAFGQADTRKNRNIKGTGLGLSISKSLVELMNGKIWAESEYGVGTTFHVTIPYIPGDEAAVEKTENEIKYIFAPTAQVLLVDDIQTNLTVCAGLLRLCGITADVAISGAEAIELVKEKDYDVVFMDHMMPDMDGIETMNIIRGLGEKYRNLPIVALTANAVNESRDFLLESGMNDFLSKPINQRALMIILQKWIPEE